MLVSQSVTTGFNVRLNTL